MNYFGIIQNWCKMASKAKTNSERLPEASPLHAGEVSAPPAIDVRALVGAGREAVILHKGDRYRLRITANDKLILTK